MIATTFLLFTWSGAGIAALTVVSLLAVGYALRSEVRLHPYTKLPRLVAAFASALTMASSYLLVHEGMLFSCEYVWWTLECLMWA